MKMKLHERGSWLFWIIVIGCASGWFGSDDDTKEKVKTTITDTARTVQEEVVECPSPAIKYNVDANTDDVVKAPSATDLIRVKDHITSAIYNASSTAAMNGEFDLTLQELYPKVEFDKGTMEKVVVKKVLGNHMFFTFGGTDYITNYDQSVGIVVSIEETE
jgi:hypothetical protein